MTTLPEVIGWGVLILLGFSAAAIVADWLVGAIQAWQKHERRRRGVLDIEPERRQRKRRKNEGPIAAREDRRR